MTSIIIIILKIIKYFAVFYAAVVLITLIQKYTEDVCENYPWSDPNDEYIFRITMATYTIFLLYLVFM